MVMNWDKVVRGYCKFNNGEAFANCSVPEEFTALNLDKAIDTFSLGSNLYWMLMGLWNFMSVFLAS